MQPSPVGGVYLSGGGEALKGLGMLTGVAFDPASGRLVLLADKARHIALPALRMDDIVAIFRNVYLHGEAPFVSIDPAPDDPHGPQMLVRHSPETAASYAGWILFEADRVMKAYGLGVDNVSRQPIASRVPGYQSMLALGFADPVQHQQTIWERFWIRPAAVTRRTSDTQRLTLLDVPLEVQTQRMVLANGKLVPAPDPTPSQPARQFSAWFTQHYDAIAAENQASSPEGTVVHFFAELRRLALIAAIAERLRDQGVPLPAWMQDYPVQRLVLTPTTPALTVQGSQTQTKQQAAGQTTQVITTTQEAQLTGGVRLAPEDKAVRTVPAAPQVRQLEGDLDKVMARAPAVGTVELTSKGTTYTAAVLPGNQTRGVGANRLEVTDISVPVDNETRIGLTRTFHSFFHPRGMLGEGWSLDLPRLEPRPQPVQRADEHTRYRTTFQLTSPLGSWSAPFREMKRVTGEVNGEIMVPDHAPDILGLASGTDPRLSVPTRQVLWRDGRRWYFDHNGFLLAWAESGLLVVYRRDKAHSIQRIEGWQGDQRRADIHLDYDASGRLTQARGSNGSSASYTYDAPGRLASVRATSGQAAGGTTVTVAYAYHEHLVTAIRQDGKEVQSFAYNPQGQLIWERRGNAPATVYTIAAHGAQTTMTARGPGAEHSATQTVYDTALRPVQRLAADGTRMEWQYASNGEVSTTTVHPDHTTTRMTRSADGQHTTWTLPAGGTQSLTRDAAGRMTRLSTASGNTIQQEWRPDGQLAMALQDGLAMQPEYQADGRLTAVRLFPPSQARAKQLDTWLRVEVDAQGRPTIIADYTGMRITLGYDATGALSARLATVDGQPHGVQLTRDDQGRVTTMKTSWGATHQQRYGPSGQLTDITVHQSFDKAPAQQARMQFDDGKIRHLTTFTGERFVVRYATQGPHTGQIERVQLPNQLALQYGYDNANRLAAITIGSSYKLAYSYDAQGRLARVSQVPLQP
jgi:YD repeat-containing protein